MIHDPRSTTRVLGIDPGTAIVGWAILEEKDGKTTPIKYGHITTPKNRVNSERILEISQDLAKIIEEFEPEEAAVEKLFFFKNVKTVMQVSEARGGILLTLEKAGLTIAEYTPLQIKQALTGYGRAEKKQVQEMVRSILNLSTIPKPDDTADAIAVAITHLQSRKSPLS